VRDAEGGEITPSFGHPSNVRRSKGSAEAKGHALLINQKQKSF